MRLPVWPTLVALACFLGGLGLGVALPRGPAGGLVALGLLFALLAAVWLAHWEEERRQERQRRARAARVLARHVTTYRRR